MSRSKPVITETSIRVVHWKLDGSASTLRALIKGLSPDERQRADRFKFPLHRARYIAARGTLRHVLGVHLDLTPADIRFAYGRHGKPELANAIDDICHFNLSHSGNVAAVAISTRPVVGLDIEESVLSDLSVADTIFSNDELNRFQALPEVERGASFMRAWTRKEAVLKALGTGFSVEPTCLEVTFEPSVPAKLLALHPPAPRPGQLSIEDLVLDACPYGAIATVDRPSNIDVVIEEFRH